MIKFDYAEIEMREAARDSLPDNEDYDYFTAWATEFGVERSEVKTLAFPLFYDGVDRSMDEIKELVKQALHFRGRIQ